MLAYPIPDALLAHDLDYGQAHTPSPFSRTCSQASDESFKSGQTSLQPRSPSLDDHENHHSQLQLLLPPLPPIAITSRDHTRRYNSRATSPTSSSPTSSRSSSASLILSADKPPTGGQLEGDLRCPYCKEHFNFVRFLNLHIRQLHDRLPVHHCPHCRSAYGTVKDLNAHILTDHAVPRAFRCKQCMCTFRCAILLQHHEREAHERFQRHCPQCAFHTVHEAVLTSHVRLRHGMELRTQDMDRSYRAAEQRTVGYISGF